MKHLAINEEISDDKIIEYKEIFNILDKNNTGIISTDVIIKLKKIFCYPINEKRFKNLINEIDIDRNRKFDFNKFVDFMRKQMQYIEIKEIIKTGIDQCNEELIYLGKIEEILLTKHKNKLAKAHKRDSSRNKGYSSLIGRSIK